MARIENDAAMLAAMADHTSTPELDAIEQAINAFEANPIRQDLMRLRAAHRAYLRRHNPWPGRELDVIRRLAALTWRGPFLLYNTTPEAVQAALATRLATDEPLIFSVRGVIGRRRLVRTAPCEMAEESWYTEMLAVRPGDTTEETIMLTAIQVADTFAYLAHH